MGELTIANSAGFCFGVTLEFGDIGIKPYRFAQVEFMTCAVKRIEYLLSA